MKTVSMKVLLDYQIFTYQSYGGISRYFCELINNFDKNKLTEYDVGIKYSNNYYLQQSQLIKVKSFFPDRDFKNKGKVQGFFNQRLTVKKIKDNDFDVFHPTYYNPYFLKYLRGKPFVLTVHDMIHEKYPGEFPPNDTTAKRKKLLAYKADKIIAISENTKKDILEYYGDIPEDKISVIYLANSLKPQVTDNDKIKIPERYLLVVGNRYHYKNCLFMIESIAQLLCEDETLFLICSGGGNLIEYEKDLFGRLGILDKVLYYPANNETLIKLYSNALAFVFPSLYEGFGIPVLEAMDCGCPAVLSNTSCLPEVGGNAAHYFDPQDAAAILKAVSEVIYNIEFRNSLITKGYKHVGKFTWEKTAEETVQIYKSLV